MNITPSARFAVKYRHTKFMDIDPLVAESFDSAEASRTWILEKLGSYAAKNGIQDPFYEAKSIREPETLAKVFQCEKVLHYFYTDSGHIFGVCSLTAS